MPRRKMIGCWSPLLALLLSTGCAMKKDAGVSNYAAPASAPQSSVELTDAFGYDPLAPSGAGGADIGGMTVGDDAMDYDAIEEEREMAPMAADVESVSVMSSRRSVSLRGAFAGAADRRAERRADKKAETAARSVMGKAKDSGGSEPAGPAPVELEAPEDPGKVATGEPKDDEPSEEQDHGRQIIYTAAMVVAVHDVDEATERAEALPKQYGGFVQQRRRGVLVLKIPAAKLQTVMADFAKYGIVQARQLQAQDVTAEYTDLESRIRVLRDTQAQLLRLLEQAKTVEETLKVRQALDQVTMELEVALGRMRQLSESISFSTLTIQFAERRPNHHLPSSNDPFRWVDQLGVEGTEWR